LFFAWDGKLYQWRIPILRPQEELVGNSNDDENYDPFNIVQVFDDETAEETAGIPPDDNSERGSPEPGYHTIMAPQGPWAVRPRSHHLMVLQRGADLAFLKVEILPPIESSSEDSPNVVAHRITTLHGFPSNNILAASPRPCDQDLVFLSWKTASQSIFAHFFSAKEPQSSVVEGIELKAGIAGLLVRESPLCPATGRLCVLTSRSEVFIMDFLPGNVESRNGGLCNAWRADLH